MIDMETSVPNPRTMNESCREKTSETQPKSGLITVEMRQLSIAPAEIIVALFPEGMFRLRRSLRMGKYKPLMKKMIRMKANIQGVVNNPSARTETVKHRGMMNNDIFPILLYNVSDEKAPVAALNLKNR